MIIFIRKIKDGIGFGIGFFLIFGIILGVYAFVEPLDSPTNNYVFDWSSPLNMLHNDTNQKIDELVTKLESMNSTLYLSSRTTFPICFASSNIRSCVTYMDCPSGYTRIETLQLNGMNSYGTTYRNCCSVCRKN